MLADRIGLHSVLLPLLIWKKILSAGALITHLIADGLYELKKEDTNGWARRKEKQDSQKDGMNEIGRLQHCKQRGFTWRSWRRVLHFLRYKMMRSKIWSTMIRLHKVTAELHSWIFLIWVRVGTSKMKIPLIQVSPRAISKQRSKVEQLKICSPSKETHSPLRVRTSMEWKASWMAAESAPSCWSTSSRSWFSQTSTSRPGFSVWIPTVLVTHALQCLR